MIAAVRVITIIFIVIIIHIIITTFIFLLLIIIHIITGAGLDSYSQSVAIPSEAALTSDELDASRRQLREVPAVPIHQPPVSINRGTALAFP
jgi:hypothetical protein